VVKPIKRKGEGRGEGLDRAGFAREAGRVLARMGISVRYDPAQFALVADDDKESVGTIYLANFWDEYLAAPAEVRPDYFERFRVLSPPDMPETFEEVRGDVLPVLRPRLHYEQIAAEGRLRNWKDAPGYPRRSLGDHLELALAHDSPTSIRDLTLNDLRGWGVDPQAAHEQARINLRERSVEPWPRLEPRVRAYVSPWQDNLDGGRLALHSLFRSLDLRGDPVAVVPNRDHVLVAGSEDSEALTLLAMAATDLSGAPRPLCPLPVVLPADAETWERFEPRDGTPEAAPFRQLELAYLTQTYAAQKELLEALHEAGCIDDGDPGDPPFVASLLAFETADQLISVATWTQGVEALLPEAHRISLIDPDSGRCVLAAWDQVREVCGALLQPTRHYPPRWLVREFPRSSQVDQLLALGAQLLGGK
jgi:hypothetical protein